MVSLTTAARGGEPVGVRGDVLAAAGRAVLRADAEELLFLSRRHLDQPFGTALSNAALVIAYAQSENGSQLASAPGWTSKDGSQPTKEFRAKLHELSPRSIAVSPAEASLSTLALVKRQRRAMLQAALRGDSSGLVKMQRATAGDLPSQIKGELDRFAAACLAIAPEFHQTQITTAIAMALAIQKQSERQADVALEIVGEYRAATDQQRQQLLKTRGNSDNAYSLTIAREQEKAKLVQAYAQVYTAYLNGEKTKVEVMQQMQAVQSKAMDLKEKRALMYWTLKDLHKKNQQAKREATFTRNQRLTREAESATASSLSAVWPSLFSHRALRDEASSLRDDLQSYSLQNSGQLSVCYARCAKHIRELQRRLLTDLDGLALEQRGVLVRYLRKLEDELKKSYSPSSYIVQLNSPSPAPGRREATKFASAMNDVEPITVNLGGDDRTLASFALYRSLLASLVRAAQQEDRARLTGLAVAIRESQLLTPEHKQRLNRIGSEAFRGNLDKRDLLVAEQPEEVLEDIAGVSGISGEPLLDVPAADADVAFQLLVSNALQNDER